MQPGQKRIIHNGWGYGVGMQLISYYNTKINKFKQNAGNDFKDMYALLKVVRAWKEYMIFRNRSDGASHLPKSRKKSTGYNYTIKNKYRYIIKDIIIVKNTNPGDTRDIYMDLYCHSTDDMLYNIPMHLISILFQPFFASTIAGIQGAKIEQPFSIWEMNKQIFDRNLFNSATGRSTCRAHVHFSNTDPNRVYEWAKYSEFVIVESRPCHNSNGYHETQILYHSV